jgi:hypothetical protein
MTVAAIALVAVALAAFAWIAGSGVAGAAGTSGSGSNAGGQLQPVQQSEGQTPPADRAAPDGDRDGHPCPEDKGGSGSGSGSAGEQDAPSSATPETAL